MKISVETVVKAKVNKVWDAWNDPADIKQWNAAQDDWHTTRSTVDLREGGKFLSRMEAKDGREGFDFEGTYTRIVPHKTIEYRMTDGREVNVEFVEHAGGGRPNTTELPAHGLAGDECLHRSGKVHGWAVQRECCLGRRCRAAA